MKFKRDVAYLVIIAFLTVSSLGLYYTREYKPKHETKVYYNQEHDLDQEIVSAVQGADKFVYFAIYTFTKTDIESALLAAKYKGLTVIGITDTKQYQSATGQKKIIDDLRAHGIPVYEQNTSGIMHMKAVVTDKVYASGSYNWTTAATTINDEVLEVSSDKTVREEYQEILEGLFKKYGGM
jgi:phosphatidylserine/phosphatidylglycerophosphate/cardiolipin synthase-like enzyme